MGIVDDANSLSLFLKRDVAHALRTIDLPLLALAHKAAMDGAAEKLAAPRSTFLGLAPYSPTPRGGLKDRTAAVEALSTHVE